MFGLQIEENTKILTSLGYRFTQATPTRETDSRPTSSLKPSDSPITTLQSQGGRATPSDKWKQGARRILLQWVQELIKRYDDGSLAKVLKSKLRTAVKNNLFILINLGTVIVSQCRISVPTGVMAMLSYQ